MTYRTFAADDPLPATIVNGMIRQDIIRVNTQAERDAIPTPEGLVVWIAGDHSARQCVLVGGVPKWVPVFGTTDWAPITMAANWTIWNASWPVRWRLFNGFVEFDGLARWNTTGSPAAESIMFPLPLPFGGPNQQAHQGTVLSNFSAAVVAAHTDGNMKFKGPATVTNALWIAMNNVRYPVA